MFRGSTPSEVETPQQAHSRGETAASYDDLYRNERGQIKPEYRAPETDAELEAHMEAMKRIQPSLEDQ